MVRRWFSSPCSEPKARARLSRLMMEAWVVVETMMMEMMMMMMMMMTIVRIIIIIINIGQARQIRYDFWTFCP